MGLTELLRLQTKVIHTATKSVLNNERIICELRYEPGTNTIYFYYLFNKYKLQYTPLIHRNGGYIDGIRELKNKQNVSNNLNDCISKYCLNAEICETSMYCTNIFIYLIENVLF